MSNEFKPCGDTYQFDASTQAHCSRAAGHRGRHVDSALRVEWGYKFEDGIKYTWGLDLRDEQP